MTRLRRIRDHRGPCLIPFVFRQDAGVFSHLRIAQPFWILAGLRFETGQHLFA